MFPFHLRLGPFAISPEEVFVVLGVALVAALSRRRMAELGVSWGALFDLSLAATVGGAIGARLYYFVPLWVRGLEEGSHLVTRWADGSGFYGGFVGGATAVLILARIKKLPGLGIADAALAPFPAGFAVGKLGCFFAGCCYGLRTDGFPGLRFPPGSLAYNTQLAAREIPKGAASSLPVHPAQLYEFAFGLALFAALGWLARRSKRTGEVSLAFLAAYSAWRFTIEFFRADPGRHGFNAGISDSQVVALLMMGVSAALWVLLRRREVPAEIPPVPPIQ